MSTRRGDTERRAAHVVQEDGPVVILLVMKVAAATVKTVLGGTRSPCGRLVGVAVVGVEAGDGLGSPARGASVGLRATAVGW